MYRALALLSLVACNPVKYKEVEITTDAGVEADEGPGRFEASVEDAALDAEADAAPEPYAPVPWEGDFTQDLSDHTINDTFPALEGAEWRYRPQTEDWQDPPAPEHGAVARFEVGTVEDEWIREVISVYEATRGEPRMIHQRVVEVWGVDDSTPEDGSTITFKRAEMEEHDLLTRAFIRAETREYDPPYTVIVDARNPSWDPNPTTTTTLRQTLRTAEEPELKENELADFTVEVEIGAPQPVPMEGRYREDIYEVSIVDLPGGRTNRAFWVQPRVGVVQFSYGAEQGNATYTLMSTNVEAAGQ